MAMIGFFLFLIIECNEFLFTCKTACGYQSSFLYLIYRYEQICYSA